MKQYEKEKDTFSVAACSHAGFSVCKSCFPQKEEGVSLPENGEGGAFQWETLPAYEKEAYVTVNEGIPFLRLTRLRQMLLKDTVSSIVWDAAGRPMQIYAGN